MLKCLFFFQVQYLFNPYLTWDPFIHLTPIDSHIVHFKKSAFSFLVEGSIKGPSVHSTVEIRQPFVKYLPFEFFECLVCNGTSDSFLEAQQ